MTADCLVSISDTFDVRLYLGPLFFVSDEMLLPIFWCCSNTRIMVAGPGFRSVQSLELNGCCMRLGLLSDSEEKSALSWTA